MMKNWLPAELGSIARAMLITPRVCLMGLFDAVGQELALDAASRGRRCRCPAGQPPWIIKPGMTRWKVRPL